MTNIDVGNIVRLNTGFECKAQNDLIRVTNSELSSARAPLQVISTGNYEKDKEYCMVSGDGFDIMTDCNNLIKVKEKGEIPSNLLRI